MQNLDFRCHSLWLVAAAVAVALCAGCAAVSTSGGTFAPAGSGANGATTVTRSAWMQPDAQRKSLLYVSSVLTNDVYVYSYANQTLVGTLTGFKQPYGLCVDKTGDVWIVDDGAQQIVEYKHGGASPIATLSDPGEYPEGCSVDPTTGNLAVTNFYSTSGNGSVSIYANASGEPKIYSDSSIANFRFCGYDDKGNLFADGANNSSEFAFAELRKGGSSLTNIALQQNIEWPGGVAWDGKHVAVGDTDTGIIYRTNGAGGKVKGSTTLGDSDYVNQFWIAGKTVVAPSQDGGDVGLYAYPGGGAPSKTISVEEPFGAAVSS
jgi:hypothetical protein